MLDTTDKSIEEIATTILYRAKLTPARLLTGVAGSRRRGRTADRIRMTILPIQRSTPCTGLWCAMLTPIGRDGGVDHARFADHARCASRARGRRRRAVRHHRRRPVVFDGRARGGTRRAARGGRAGRAHRRRHRLRGADRDHCADARERAGRVAPAASCCRRSFSRTCPTTACSPGTHASSKRWPIRGCAFSSTTSRKCRASRSPWIWWRGSRRRSPASLPASRTARAIGRTRRRCSSACRASRSSSATNLTCRACCAQAAPGRSAASRTCIRRWSGH